MSTNLETPRSCLFTTGCLHLNPENYEGVIRQIVSELNEYSLIYGTYSNIFAGWSHSRFLVLAGDIIDPTPKHADIYGYLSNCVRSAGFHPIWVGGNNDLWNSHPEACVWLDPNNEASCLIGDTGVNWVATPWAYYHDSVSTDAANSYYGGVLCGHVGRHLFRPDQTEVLVFHYPPFFADPKYKEYCTPIEALTAPPMFKKLLMEMPRLRHIIVGHIHDQHEYIPRHIATENGVIKVTLATKKANGLITVVGEV